VEQELKLAEFRTLYRYYRRYIGWYDHLLLAALVWIESKVIWERTANTVDTALEVYEEVEEPMPDPVYTEQPSDTSTSLPEMRLTAPWCKEGGD
jgi:hypothetical protein